MTISGCNNSNVPFQKLKDQYKNNKSLYEKDSWNYCQIKMSEIDKKYVE